MPHNAKIDARVTLNALLSVCAFLITIYIKIDTSFAEDLSEIGIHHKASISKIYPEWVSAKSINNHGQVVGEFLSDTGEIHAFMWSNGDFHDIHAFDDNTSSAYFINDCGQIIGEHSSRIKDNTPEPPGTVGYILQVQKWKVTQIRSFIWENGAASELTYPGIEFARPLAINNAGQTVGDFFDKLGQHCFIFENGKITDMGTSADEHSRFCTAINDFGLVVGEENSGHIHSSFLFENGVRRELPSLGGGFTKAYSVNNAGMVVGESRMPSGTPHAVIWQDAQIRDLGSLSGEGRSMAYAVNNKGQVVGASSVNGSSEGHAFIWQDGRMVDLDTLLPPGSGWRLWQAEGINDHGQIIGSGSYRGKASSFVLSLPTF